MSFDKAFFSKTNFECVQAAGVEGCKTTDSTYLHWVDCAVFIPNIFTPNDDNINDAWSVHFGSVRQIKIEVLNRWGNI
jgi:hypothetical protein